MRKLLTFCLFGSIIISCNNKADQTKTDKDTTNQSFDADKGKHDLEDRNTMFLDAFHKKDSVGMANFYLADGLIMPEGGEAVKKENMASFWGGFMGFAKDFKLSIWDVSGKDDMLVETGGYEIFGDNNS